MKNKGSNWIHMFSSSIEYSWKAGPFVFFSVIFSSAAKCIFQLAEIYLLQNLFYTITRFAGKECEIQYVYHVIFEMAVVMIISQIVELGEYLAQGYFWRRGNGYLHSLFHRHLSQCDAIEFENSDFLNAVDRACRGCEDAPEAIRNFLQIIFYYIPFCVLTGWYLYKILPIMLLALGVISLSALASELVKANSTYKYENRVAGLNRKMDYYEKYIASREYIKETRFLGIKNFFIKKYDDTLALLKIEFHLKEQFGLKSNMVLNVINVIGYTLVFLILVLCIKRGYVNVVEFATIYFAVEKVKSTLEDVISRVGDTLQNVAKMSFLFEFLDRSAVIIKNNENLPKKENIILKNVSFRYPGTEEDVIKNLSLKINAGETTAIVGDNGAGKSTLVKLLIGLYQPSEGNIIYGNREVKEYSSKAIHENVSAVFQNFGKYWMTLEDNIKISSPWSKKDCRELLKIVGLNVQKFSSEEQEMLGKEFGGSDISGGEWQRVAIARGIYRTSDIIVLDEPTASIDPIEESKLFELFYQISNDRTCILVTHRMGAVKMADRILMLEDGKVIEEGSHAELMAKREKYYKLYNLQSKWY